MSREKVDYRDQLVFAVQRISEMFPESGGMLSTSQVAAYFGCDVRAVLRMRERKRNPLPSVDISNGKKPVWRYPITSVVRWSLGA